MTLAVTSDTVPLPDVQNLVDTRLAQKISQVPGVGLVTLSGGQRPAVRIQADTQSLADRKSTRLNSSHIQKSRMPSSA